MINLAQTIKDFTGQSLTAGQIAAFASYERALQEWNQRINLTAIEDRDQIRVKHFLDSLTCLGVLRGRAVERVIDVGTGAGFPGIPLKIALPSIQLTLVESVSKKAEFCQHIVTMLNLDMVCILPARVEEVGQDPTHREKYDFALARAVAEMPVLAEYLLPMVRLGGSMVAMKGASAPQEAQAAQRAFTLLGGRLQKIVPIILPGVAEERFLVIVDKVAATPPAYPRRTGVPAKKPL
jgi:16S rRNA (guanine527-N7)-methyltransferase